MKKIFESEYVNLQQYFEARFSVDTPSTYISGNTIKIPVNIEYLLLGMPEETNVYYAMTIEDEMTVECIKVDGLKIDLISPLSPSELLKSELLKVSLGILIFESLQPDSESSLNLAVKNMGYRINKERIYTNSYPYKITRKNDYLIIQNPIFYLPGQLKGDKEEFEKQLNRKQHITI